MSSQLDDGYYVVPTVMFLSSLHPNGNDVMAVLFAITEILLLSVSLPKHRHSSLPCGHFCEPVSFSVLSTPQP